MANYKGFNVGSATGVDDITGDRIEVVTGGIREEMKLHRQAIKALSALAFKGNHTTAEVEDAQVIALRLELIDKQIEDIILEGKIFKKENGFG